MSLIISLSFFFSTLTAFVLLAFCRRDFNQVVAIQSRTFEEDFD